MPPPVVGRLPLLTVETETSEDETYSKPLPLRDLMKELAEEQLLSVRENFVQGGRPRRWPPKVDRLPRHLYESGTLYRSLLTRSGTDWFEVYTNVRYAAIQHFGGITNPRVTPRSRRFFWFMFDQTKDEKWRAMALTDKKKFVVRIPPAPYMVWLKTDVERITKKLAGRIADWSLFPAGTQKRKVTRSGGKP